MLAPRPNKRPSKKVKARLSSSMGEYGGEGGVPSGGTKRVSIERSQEEGRHALQWQARHASQGPPLSPACLPNSRRGHKGRWDALVTVSKGANFTPMVRAPRCVRWQVRLHACTLGALGDANAVPGAWLPSYTQPLPHLYP